MLLQIFVTNPLRRHLYSEVKAWAVIYESTTAWRFGIRQDMSHTAEGAMKQPSMASNY
jgi:hypothetical protein